MYRPKDVRLRPAVVVGRRPVAGVQPLLLARVSHELIRRAGGSVILVPTADAAAARFPEAGAR
jgi:hypothetical protein